MLAFLADVIATALLKGRKFGGLLAFIFFIVLSAIISRVNSLVPSAGTGVANMLVHCGVSLAFAITEYVATATIMERKLSV